MKQTLLLGNGLNLLIDKDKWEWKNLLTRCLKQNFKLVGADKKTVPYTHLYEDMYLNAKVANSTLELDVKKGIADKLKELTDSQNEKFNDIMQNLLSIDFDDILTTNYDYSIEKYFNNVEPPPQSSGTRKERIYSIRRNNVVEKGNTEKRIWHIHGEAEFPESMMLGYDHYCGSIAKISEYLKSGKSGEEKIENFLEGNKFHYIVRKIKFSQNVHDIKYRSWLDAIFLSDVHILGLGLGFSEIDLWWVLNKRYRYIKETFQHAPNNIYYYGNTSSDIKDMLEAYGVNVDNTTTRKLSNDEWNILYKEMISKMKMHIG